MVLQNANFILNMIGLPICIICMKYPFTAPYVKVYLIDGKTCIEKQKSKVARRTLDPLYQQALVFNEPYSPGKIIQVFVLTHHLCTPEPH